MLAKQPAGPNAASRPDEAHHSTGVEYRSEHVMAQVRPAKQALAHLVICQVLEGLRPRGLCHLQAAVDVMVPIQQDLRLHDGHKASILQETSLGVGAYYWFQDSHQLLNSASGSPIAANMPRRYPSVLLACTRTGQICL